MGNIAGGGDAQGAGGNSADGVVVAHAVDDRLEGIAVDGCGSLAGAELADENVDDVSLVEGFEGSSLRSVGVVGKDVDL